jgi:microcompartment protein CcmL/EutN
MPVARPESRNRICVGGSMGEALGMIETRGLVAMIEAADAMVKAAKVTLTTVRLKVEQNQLVAVLG